MGVERDSLESRAGNAHASREPALVLSFVGSGLHDNQRRPIPSQGFVLGRGTCVFDEPFDDPRMSLSQAEVRVDDGRAMVRDLGSGSSTRVNGKPLMGTHQLAHGDVLRLGDTLIVFTLPQPIAAPNDMNLIGESAAMVAVRRSVLAVARHKRSVIISGETGTGKEVVARLIHDRSGAVGPFVGVNCGTFTEGLLPSELFGHVRGAFTGAAADQPGLFRAARGGTLLLDEVSDMPLALQMTLLRVLETGEVRPVGGTREFAVDVRVVATSNRDLMELVERGEFRSDLYSRLAQWTVRLPPLRERREDIPALAINLLARCEGSGRTLSPDLAEALLLHDWPLNVRGLFNVLAIAVISSGPDEALSLGDEVRAALRTTGSVTGPQLDRVLPVISKIALENLLALFKGKIAAAARHLGVTRPKLYRMLWAEGIEPARFRCPSRPERSRTPANGSIIPEAVH
jgi:transcriptional regulator of acetoin/glycerol metabolism